MCKSDYLIVLFCAIFIAFFLLIYSKCDKIIDMKYVMLVFSIVAFILVLIYYWIH